MTEESYYSNHGIKLALYFNPSRKHISIGDIILEEENAKNHLPLVLRSIVKELNPEQIGKVYVTLPSNLSYLAHLAGFKREAVFPTAFHTPTGQSYQDGVDLVYFLDQNRMIDEEKKSNIKESVYKIITSASKKNHLTKLNEEGYVLREGKIDDANQIANVWSNAFLGDCNYPFGLSSKEVEQDFEEGNHLWYVCESPDKKIVGLTRAHFDEGESVLEYTTRMCDIQYCAVLPEARGKGIMVELVRILTDLALDKDQVPCSYCFAEEEGIQRVMASLGYIPTGVSSQTNRLLTARNGNKRAKKLEDIPFVNNVVWFYCPKM